MFSRNGSLPTDKESQKLVESIIVGQWKEYLDYLKGWADNHKNDSFKTISESPKPLSFSAWQHLNAIKKGRYSEL